MTCPKNDSFSPAESVAHSLSEEFRELAASRSPEAALARVFSSWTARIRRDSEEVAEVLEQMPSLTASWRAALGNDVIDYTVDRIGDDETAWFAWWGFLLEQGDHPTFAIVSNLDALGGIERAAPGQLSALLERLADGRLSLRLIVPPEAAQGRIGELMAELETAGAQLRVGDVSDWFAVTPHRAALLPAVWGEDRDVDALVVHTPAIVAALEQLFLARWSRARPWSESLDPAIELLCEGRTDAQVAERLGISVRSVRRRVAAEMRRTGAVTRTQLGFRLALGLPRSLR